MKTNRILFALAMIAWVGSSCSQPSQDVVDASASNIEQAAGQSAVQDDESQKNIVQTAIGSPQHTTLVAALKAAAYVDALSNAGPFTVFAPTDEAFAKLPAGTVEDLTKPENKLKLQNILEYHVYVGVIRESMVQGPMKLNQVNGKNVSITKESDKLKVNGANVLATIQTSNGIVYVIDTVLLPE
ncbi:fasciclin domain-containing protein [Pseudochryseolinea flava]|uniref:Fasciclin domain-containing protein n=1 Tax=Pseudochryseolinea flava TaxID=2059302 RepID=A0A364Y639_9BACT|nr:fasciclin domain-containing protein [Pseudochryseolinea flava]RAW02554.1 fasciclin domain-containing protein [Pseudochryseolinea flava]